MFGAYCQRLPKAVSQKTRGSRKRQTRRRISGTWKRYSVDFIIKDLRTASRADRGGSRGRGEVRILGKKFKKNRGEKKRGGDSKREIIPDCETIKRGEFILPKRLAVEKEKLPKAWTRTLPPAAEKLIKRKKTGGRTLPNEKERLESGCTREKSHPKVP